MKTTNNPGNHKNINNPEHDQSLVVLEHSVSPIVIKARGITITNVETMTKAVEMLSSLNVHRDYIETEKEKVTKPINQALQAERARWKPIETILGQGIDILRDKISSYQTAELKRVNKQENKIANKIGDGKGQITLDEAEKRLSLVEQPQMVITTSSGSLSFRETQVLKITDYNSIPDQFWILDEKKVLDALKSGIKITGVELDTVVIPVNKR